MTLHHLLRTAAVAGLATLLLAAVQQARAESGDEPSVYVAVSVDTRGQVEEATLADEQLVGADQATEGAKLADDAKPDRKPGGRTIGEARQQVLELKPLVMQYAMENDIPFGLADAVIRLESRYNPKARNGFHVGLTQINAQTAQSLGYRGAAEGLLDPETNLRYGLKYLGRAYKLADGDTCDTILRFRAGHRAETMTSATRRYCAKVQTLLASAD
jgi:soluble lytic murein transglycosylase-like protein